MLLRAARARGHGPADALDVKDVRIAYASLGARRQPRLLGQEFHVTLLSDRI